MSLNVKEIDCYVLTFLVLIVYHSAKQNECKQPRYCSRTRNHSPKGKRMGNIVLYIAVLPCLIEVICGVLLPWLE